ncbi:3-hydroxyacyl-CoA dehydrogenase [Streptomyces justiciae]|uniref:3-hydroxyacyl-CoA dehydrogenase n=1 Tax=Streptomyces justiciae TaxID=2780140 RepID=UPI0021190038|nr:3-hydroxyacyl-CoA dehydrogenase [Streptomyces justiciae]MCW8383902.1 3-hydroxyacyl-CoA dehydrogenase [Streptomyces justiciae]
MTEFSRIAVLGVGVLGSQIAYHTAFKGYDIVAYDVDDNAVDRARTRLAALADRYEREVEDAGAGARDIVDRIELTSDLLHAVSAADLVIEAAPELVSVKRRLFSVVGEAAPAHTVFATNTSAIPPSALMDSTGRPDRFLALHFSNLVWRHNIAEVMGTPRTDPDVYASVVRFAASIGMVPIEMKKEKPGYVLNSLLVPLLKAAGELLADDIADPAAVDDVWRIGTGAAYGPFEMLDIIGLMTAHHIASHGDAKQREFARLIKERYLDKGQTGVESGQGFYTYPPT